MTQESNRPKSLWARPFAALAVFGLALLAAVGVLLAPGGEAVHGQDTAAASAVAGPAEVRLAADSVPDRAWKTLQLIDAGQWPDAADAPGTKGGGDWSNREGQLPATDGSGNRISYREWDVNPKKPGQNRDAERIVTGSDGSAWYTGDHYGSFTKMR
ncbi:guanyl-specific ribonuclease Sa [Nocardia transvalensis]|uniref:Guanyl-specific ribonuclease Sa n=1 Tax=Nocardia transvalensis TaxID=37333 RepID=A0A7W9UIS9_9NOCA|nr:ribonuclease domain-containing protein [Nocardia transvalensis]MBB5914718.1 guanyl-specific ribonuclease Sa [Nocardia transvalensis]